ncbi:pep-cterm sorting domain-containing protein [Anaeramoeba ignava]|uniref:Pep-cterm sorting domain-containing protein n=1 Tax=Anaeramoeba ignava TaxID=1746090 RepID=A0A9Q0LSQ8_ANAIG|nr:pep-cterm sorting domain-containing protein [Anaeramoeba ignava]
METYLNLEKLSNDLKNLFQNQNENEKENETYFDFEIICEQNKISFKTHKSILSSRSQYFKSLFNSKMKEYQENKLILKDVSSSILFSILHYFYSGKIEINSENAIEILIFSSKYLIDELIEFSLNFIKKNLQIETVIDILKLSESMNLNELLESCYQFIYQNFEKFIKTSFFLELEENHLNSILLNDYNLIDEFELFQSIIKWGKHKSNINQEKQNQKLEKEEKEKLQDRISNIIDKIRFIDFSKEQLEDILKQDLIPNQISQKLNEFQKFQNDKEINQFIQKENQNSFIFKSRIKFDSKIIQDILYFKKLKEWINDNEFFSKMRKGFSAKRDGFDSRNWHSKCDNKGKTLIVIKTKDNFIFGGFTQIGFTNDKSKWRKQDRNDTEGWIIDPKAFIFSLRNDKNDRKPEKFKIKQGEEQFAIHYTLNKGPIFGFGIVGDISLNYDLQSGSSNFGFSYNLPKGIKSNTNEAQSDISLNYYLQPGRSNFGNNYNLPKEIKSNTDESKSYLAGSYQSWVVDELETYFI